MELKLKQIKYHVNIAQRVESFTAGTNTHRKKKNKKLQINFIEIFLQLKAERFL